MKPVATAVTVGLSLALTAGSAIARCDDNISYAITKDGQCVDLTSFTELSKIRGQIADLNRQRVPIVLNNLKLREVTKGVYQLEGIATNQSRRTVQVNRFQATFTDKIDGNVKAVKTLEIPFARTIPAGGTRAIEYPILDDSLSENYGIVASNIVIFE